MADLNLTGQATLSGQIQTRITQMQTSMNQRKAIWDRLSDDKKRAWIKSGKDPLMTLAWNIFKYLKNNFFREEDTNV